jgi:chemotaxis protein methyltransferase CheR
MRELSLGSGMSQRVYNELCRLIYHHSRIFLTLDKESFLASRLAQHKRELQANDWDSYLKILLRADKGIEIEKLIDLVTTNHTYFFRERQHFDRLSHELLPQLTAGNPQTRTQLKCWSVAASSGEEVVTLAITLAEYAKHNMPFDWYIHATDISWRMLKKAQAAIYAIDVLNLPSEQLMARYFLKGTGDYQGQCKVKTELMQKVKYARANIFQSKLPVPDRFHVILCRNVMLYFDQTSQQQLISRLEQMLEPGGLLLIGLTESIFNLNHKLEKLNDGIFRRIH